MSTAESAPRPEGPPSQDVLEALQRAERENLELKAQLERLKEKERKRAEEKEKKESRSPSPRKVQSPTLISAEPSSREEAEAGSGGGDANGPSPASNAAPAVKDSPEAGLHHAQQSSAAETVDTVASAMATPQPSEAAVCTASIPRGVSEDTRMPLMEKEKEECSGGEREGETETGGPTSGDPSNGGEQMIVTSDDNEITMEKGESKMRVMIERRDEKDKTAKELVQEVGTEELTQLFNLLQNSEELSFGLTAMIHRQSEDGKTSSEKLTLSSDTKEGRSSAGSLSKLFEQFSDQMQSKDRIEFPFPLEVLSSKDKGRGREGKSSDTEGKESVPPVSVSIRFLDDDPKEKDEEKKSVSSEKEKEKEGEGQRKTVAASSSSSSEKDKGQKVSTSGLEGLLKKGFLNNRTKTEKEDKEAGSSSSSSSPVPPLVRVSLPTATEMDSLHAAMSILHWDPKENRPDWISLADKPQLYCPPNTLNLWKGTKWPVRCACFRAGFSYRNHVGEQGDWLGELQRVLDEGHDINEIDENGRSSLHFAAQICLEDAAAMLIMFGANCELQDNTGWTPLHQSCMSGSYGITHNLLTRGGADPRANDMYGITPLHKAAGRHIVELLLGKCGYTVLQATDAMGRTPLHTTAARGKLGSVQALFDYGADLFAVDFRGKTAVDYARWYREDVVADELEKMMAEDREYRLREKKRREPKKLPEW
uniref:Uncharacterized protein n=1 Tax=Chromera velia CCMP2878 TaxID=1169474 RepID=A0A0G4GQC8_9ALVE|eukprot:Cvel_22870.t1-p1 / transcript=Cvel_22870.t1 / gene=Cvel_22870 / organism=Chromera_velia_CCMP2878 / gene_product=Ankyrin repeat and protein kinase domain-containing, putative / transcript_product=Ankyrin repeat and protein kinase domain-containing, putative / location=Cvel_scaffold2295:25292-30205(+) / protein_length=706 / sequence_SO=supercontig / SO=protein_coding / is_pseudo=false